MYGLDAINFGWYVMFSTFFSFFFFFLGLQKPQVAGSVGPYGACQHDASEYHGNYVDSMSIQVSKKQQVKSSIWWCDIFSITC